ncbi:MAG: signal peptidase I [Dehalococcoidales bacterium]|nr:signal peptidase I [Dehalococcoidales bacterium]
MNNNSVKGVHVVRAMKIVGWVVTSALILFIAGLGFIHFVPGYSFSLVRSGSMTPAINVGDVIITRPASGAGVDGNIKSGAIVMYTHDGQLITHRVVSVNGSALSVKGDALEHPDPWPVVISNVQGVYLFKIPYIGYAMNFVRTKLGWFLAIIIPAAAIVGLLVKDILKETFKDEKKTQNSKDANPAVKQEETVKS